MADIDGIKKITPTRQEAIATTRQETKTQALSYPQRLNDLNIVEKLSQGIGQMIEIEEKCLEVLNTLDLSAGNEATHYKQKENLLLALGGLESVSRTYERIQNISKSMSDQMESVTRFTYEMCTKPMLSKLIQQEVPGIIRDLKGMDGVMIEDTPEVRKVFLEHIRTAFEKAQATE